MGMRVNAWASAILAVGLWAAASPHANAEIPQSARDGVADWTYADCSGKAYPPDSSASASSMDAFCRCFADYLMDLLTDDEILYLASYLEPTLDIIDKEQRAKTMCSALAQ